MGSHQIKIKKENTFYRVDGTNTSVHIPRAMHCTKKILIRRVGSAGKKMRVPACLGNINYGFLPGLGTWNSGLDDSIARSLA